MSKFSPLCHVDDLENDSTKGFLENENGQDAIFIVKKNGELYGWKNACPHVQGAPMAWRKDQYLNTQKTHLTCFAHGALFDPTTGLCIQGPCLGKTLEKVELFVSSEGIVSFLDLNNKNKES
ncbi:Rieske (2Fe-2S) protein [Marinomonas posidonica]|uniref:Rieske (2Fe-2S) iron-sulfur domain protein n=1 Tax=Marinomonas posidonica (strain CECT 7376 / NCIMB 14433 / IVIA-Po-181) TaxID=491952 RepID=F6CW65_MARPP|nr:Rieske (2Fe-2S) protein [Marinomonas posidonica]AEF55426.1 Rieske (2Fe-2S) iron-sulfur domain protein [Marinomonas posidonica IVIA-Po-181]